MTQSRIEAHGSRSSRPCRQRKLGMRESVLFVPASTRARRLPTGLPAHYQLFTPISGQRTNCTGSGLVLGWTSDEAAHHHNSFSSSSHEKVFCYLLSFRFELLLRSAGVALHKVFRPESSQSLPHETVAVRRSRSPVLVIPLTLLLEDGRTIAGREEYQSSRRKDGQGSKDTTYSCASKGAITVGEGFKERYRAIH